MRDLRQSHQPSSGLGPHAGAQGRVPLRRRRRVEREERRCQHDCSRHAGGSDDLWSLLPRRRQHDQRRLHGRRRVRSPSTAASARARTRSGPRPASAWPGPSTTRRLAPRDSNFSPQPTTSPPFGDPYALMALPTRGTLPNKSSTTTCNGTIDPGVYGNLTLGNNATCILNPGLYIITGRWLEGNHSLIKGDRRVTLYFTCGSRRRASPLQRTDVPGSGGYLDAKNGDLDIASGATGFTAFARHLRPVEPEQPARSRETAATERGITGAVYAPNATLDFNGNSTFNFTYGPVVVESADGNGNQSGRDDQQLARRRRCRTRAAHARPVAPASGLRRLDLAVAELLDVDVLEGQHLDVLGEPRRGGTCPRPRRRSSSTSKNTSPASVRAFTSTWLHR